MNYSFLVTGTTCFIYDETGEHLLGWLKREKGTRMVTAFYNPDVIYLPLIEAMAQLGDMK